MDGWIDHEETKKKNKDWGRGREEQEKQEEKRPSSWQLIINQPH